MLAPSTVQPGAPLLVVVHGISERAAEQVVRFAKSAEKQGVVLVAPLFTRRMFGQYQRVIDRQGRRSDLALLDIVETVARQTACDARKFHIFGFSGGAQFAHRFAMLNPMRIRSMSVAAAGWYTMPDAELNYPYGISTHPIAGEKFRPEHFLSIERHVFVGSKDNIQDAALKSTRKLDERQGTTRLERGRRWVEEMDKAASALGVSPVKSTFSILQGVGHSFSAAARRCDLPTLVLSNIPLN